MKLFALFLPQFHSIPENDEWWGKNFTEWVNVKNAKALYAGHNQPKHPEEDNYYNLLDRKTVEWQTKIMKDAKIDGMIYYHYYFCGKKLLEKPAENLLKWSDIDQPFFFCWANHTWNRAWKGSREILVEQRYGGINEWTDHFNYLLPFFKDARYEKVNNCPVFMIYQPNFAEKNEMMAYFDKLARENGFNGMYVIEECMNCSSEYLDSIKREPSVCTKKYYLTEPSSGKTMLLNPRSSKIVMHINGLLFRLRQKGIIKSVQRLSGEKIYNLMMRNEPYSEEIIHGVFFEWDNTPRHGTRGYVITPPRKDTFLKYFDKIKDDDFIIANAWNEWAEGMILEPTQELGDRYLQWIKEAVERSENNKNKIS